MRTVSKRTLILIIGIAAGLTGGYLYWRFVGCSTGSCAITSHWYTSAVFGGLAGYLLSDGLSDVLSKRKTG